METLEQQPSIGNQARPAKTSAGVSWVLVIVAVGVLGLGGWNWWDTRQQMAALQYQLAKRLAEADDRLKQNQTLVTQATQNVQQLQAKLAVVENKLAESQNQQVALEALYQELSRNRDDWSLTEIEQILNIANQQLQLAGNVSAALVALQAADARLQRIDKPQLAGLRRVIDQDIQRLKALPFVDTVGNSVKLDNLVLAVEVLPLLPESPPSAVAQSSPPTTPASGMWARIARATWGEIKAVIRIQRLEQPEAPLLSPEQSYFLRENLKLRLLSARLALLARDETSYRSDLNAARDWLNRYFDTQSKGVQNAIATLRQLAEGSISIAMPDISASLESVHNYKLSRDGTTP